MKVVAINGSPLMDKGNTALILNPFLDGIREAGAGVELLYTKKLKINPCQGCLSCWLKTPGKCIQKDDMEIVLETMKGMDVFILATPLFVDGMSGPLKNLLDRIVPTGQPFIELRDGHCRHPGRGKSARKIKMALVSNCGFWEIDNFDALVAHVKAISRNMSAEFVGALLRPQGPALKPMLDMGMPVKDILDAAKEAGRQLVQTGHIKEATLQDISRELMPLKEYMDFGNQYFQQTLEALAKKKIAS
jgi:multimeric flavodoxin WrbA